MPLNTDMLLLGIAMLLLFYAIICSYMQECKGRELLRWVKTQYPEVWISTPWILRHIVTSYMGLLRIHRAKQIDNAFFNEEYAAVRKYDKRIILSAVCSGVLLLLIDQ